MQLDGAQIIVEVLLEQGVDTVFGYPGGAVLNIYDALYQYSDRIRHIMTAHEQGASHAADGYSRSTGKTGVVIATSGPGATNLVTGIATAYMDSIPMVAITGNVAMPLLGRDSFQEVDITGITMPVTKHNFIIKDIRDLAPTLRQAFEIANSGRKGPVLVDVPKDMTAAVTEYVRQAAAVPYPNRPLKEERVQEAIECLRNAKKPFIYAGGGVVSAGASQELVQLAEKMQVPVACSLMGLGGFPHDHPLFAGFVGMHGTFEANKAIDACDVLLVAGARFSDRVAGNREKFAANAKIIQIDIDSAEIDKNVTTTMHVTGDLKEVLGKLEQALGPVTHHEWLGQVNEWKKEDDTPIQEETIQAKDVIECVNELAGDDAIIATDVGQHQMWVAQHYHFNRPRSLCTSGGLGTMGYGMGAAIGAQVGSPERRVVLFSGDGSFHMNLNELATLASYEIPVVVIVMNNQVLGMVRQWQKVFYESRFSSTDPHRKTDFVRLAEAFGVTGMRMETPAQMRPVLEQAFSLGKPVVIDCRLSKDENVLPMIPPGGTVDDMIEAVDC